MLPSPTTTLVLFYRVFASGGVHLLLDTFSSVPTEELETLLDVFFWYLFVVL